MSKKFLLGTAIAALFASLAHAAEQAPQNYDGCYAVYNPGQIYSTFCLSETTQHADGKGVKIAFFADSPTQVTACGLTTTFEATKADDKQRLSLSLNDGRRTRSMVLQDTETDDFKQFSKKDLNDHSGVIADVQLGLPRVPEDHTVSFYLIDKAANNAQSKAFAQAFEGKCKGLAIGQLLGAP